MEEICVWDPMQPIFHWLVLGFCVGWCKKFASPNTKDTNMLVYFALGDAKVPNANGFASQWNIGFKWQRKGIGYWLKFTSDMGTTLPPPPFLLSDHVEPE